MKSQKPKVAFVVGHKTWGKSQTLRSLTRGNYRVRMATVGDQEFFVRRMSNDDYPDKFISKMKSINPALYPFIIAALCPDFDAESDARTQAILEDLRGKGYELFFWVMERQYGGPGVVTPSELSQLRKFGKVEVFAKAVEAKARARLFEAFVSDVVLA